MQTNINILIVDDSSTIRSVVKKSLKAMGFQVESIFEAEDGQIAFQMMDENEIQFIISDLIMPKMDGLELLSKIRESEKFNETPFLMITSVTDTEKIIEAFEIGVDQFISKPFSEAFLAETVETTLAGSKIEVKEEKGNFIEGIKVLVIDDAPAMRKIVIINLKKLGFDDDHIIVAQDGAEGLKRIIKEEPTLILCDYHMPKMTGLELLKILQNDEELKNIPFIMVTSDSNKEKINESKKEGVNEYIIKPFNAAELKKRIKSVLK